MYVVESSTALKYMPSKYYVRMQLLQMSKVLWLKCNVPRAFDRRTQNNTDQSLGRQFRTDNYG